MTNASDNFFGDSKGSASYESRPRAVNPRTGQEQSWQRASNYASPLDNPHGLIRWQLRELVKGLSLRTDLARMLLTGAVIEDKAKADEVIAQALSAAEVEAKANEGTAAHAALSRAFLGHEVPSEYVRHVSAFAAELKRNGLTPVATELTLLNTALDGHGHVDWIVRTTDGRHLILDVKTGRLGEAKRKFSVQCKVYAGADYVGDGKGGWVPIPFAIDQTEAVLAHVDPETGATALYRVDLVLGFYGAVLAEQVRGWHKIEVLAPYTPVHPSIPQIGVAKHIPVSSSALDVDTPTARPDDPRTAAPEEVVTFGSAANPPVVTNIEERTPLTPMEMIQGATSQQTLGMAQRAATQNGANMAGWTWEHEQACAAKRAEWAAPVPASVAQQHPGVPTLDELMATKNTKPILQKMAKALGCTDLAHDRKWLALWIVATQAGADPAQASAYAKSKGTIPLGEVVHTAPKPVPLASLNPAEQTPFALKHIREAASAEDIERFRLNIVGRSGDHAWTDEMAEAARVRLSELAPAVSTPSVLDRVWACNKPQDIAELWSEATVGGSSPELWTPEIRVAADARLAEIQAARPAPPANPYGPQQ